MKKLFSILALSVLTGCAANVKAQSVFVMPNKAGGEITVTDRPCIISGENLKNLRAAYTWSPNAALEKACWTLIDGMVHILYLRSGERRVYPITDFRQKQ